MTFLQRTIQFFFLFLGLTFAAMFLVRWLAPDSRTVLWRVLCPTGTTIEKTPGEVEIEPGQVITAYEITCVGPGIRQPILDFQLALLETGFSLGVAIFLAVTFGWTATRRKTSPENR